MINFMFYRYKWFFTMGMPQKCSFVVRAWKPTGSIIAHYEWSDSQYAGFQEKAGNVDIAGKFIFKLT